VRISDEPLYAHEDAVHVLLALTAETIPRHRGRIAEGGCIIYDTALDVPAGVSLVTISASSACR
jgi:Pyruvate/2-oxoacid:ferredoxin oxidoreductase gamma subunit